MENAAVHAGKLHRFFHSQVSWLFPEWRAVVRAGAPSPHGGLSRGRDAPAAGPLWQPSWPPGEEEHGCTRTGPVDNF
jgi:hypothetical protein